MAAAVSTAAAVPSTVVWPCAARLADDLVQRGLLPCPAEQASAECLVEASTITPSTIATFATSSRSGSSRPMPMRMRTIRTMIATTWCGCERIMAGGGGGYMFAAELCGPGREMEAGQGRKTTGARPSIVSIPDRPTAICHREQLGWLVHIPRSTEVRGSRLNSSRRNAA